MNQGANKAYADKLTAQLQEWSAQVDVLKAKAAKGAANVRIDFHEQIESWQDKESALRKKIDALSAKGAEGYEAMKADVQTAWDETNSFIQSIIKGEKNDSQK